MDKLTQEQTELFHRVHAKHLKAMGTEEQQKRTIEHVTRVVWDGKEQCLKVYYAEGEWWHYATNGTWY